MAITSPIPLPGAPGEILAGIPSEMAQNRLRMAQEQEAMGKARQSQMLANLLQGLGDSSMPEITNGNQAQQTSQKPNYANLQKALLASGALGLPTQVIDGKLVTPFGVHQVGESPEDKSRREAKGASATQTLKSTAESSLAGLSTKSSFNALDNLMKQPNYKNIAGTLEGKFINAQPMGLPLGSYLQKTFPNQFSEQDAKLAGQVEAHFGNIITNVAAQFKGPFKDMVRGVINAMKPNMGDSIAVQKGKIETLKKISGLAAKQDRLIAQYINEGMDATEAIYKASEELDKDLSEITSSAFQFESLNENPSPTGNGNTQSKRKTKTIEGVKYIMGDDGVWYQ